MNDAPLRSGSSLYFERYARAEAQNMSLKLALCLSGAVGIFLAAGLVVVAVRPKPIHYVASMPQAGISYPGEVPAAMTLDFACAWLMNWVNYSPATAKEVYERSFNVMAPPFLARIRAGLDDELARIGREKISSVFTLKAEPRLEQGRAAARIFFTGERALYIGKEEMSREDTCFVVEVRPAPLTQADPYGLMIWDVTRQKAINVQP